MLIFKEERKHLNLIFIWSILANKEMVHAITINDSKKRITVVFRGSVTTTDFMTDAKIVHKNVENPVRKTLPNASETVDIHTGFYGT